MNILNKFQKSDFDHKCDINCFYCCAKFDTQPIPLPFKLIKGNYYVKYIFCSWECMKSYVNEMNNCNSSHIYSLIHSFYKHLTKKKYDIQFSPPRHLLKDFGGNMSIEEFRKNNKKIVYSILDNPIILSNSIIEKNDNFSWINKETANDQLNNFDKNNISNNQVKLKRQVKNKEKNTLESVMGLTRV